jgi:hypothetical protein
MNKKPVPLISLAFAKAYWVTMRPYLLFISATAGLAGFAALAAWGAWVGLYLFAGRPGFHDDGYLIILKEQADLSAAYPIAGRAERLQYVYDRLRETATRTQKPVRADLAALDRLWDDVKAAETTA